MFTNTVSTENSDNSNSNRVHINADDEYVNNSKLLAITSEDMADAISHLKRLNSKTYSYMEDKGLISKLIPLSNYIPEEEGGVTLWYCSQSFTIKKFKNNTTFINFQPH